MAESVKPIDFSAPEIRALLAGRKTQTRQVIKLPTKGEYVRQDMGGWEASTVGGHGVRYADGSPAPELPCVWNRTTGTTVVPRFAAGDRLLVREAVTRFDKGSCDQWIWYRAGGNDMEGYIGRNFPDQDPNGEWAAPEGPAGGAPYRVPSIRMPRWASRLTLHVTEVRVQRLQEISEADCIAEGVMLEGAYRYTVPEICTMDSARSSYFTLLDYLHGQGFSVANPWMAIVSFEIEHCNIDQAKGGPNQTQPDTVGFKYTPLGREAKR